MNISMVFGLVLQKNPIKIKNRSMRIIETKGRVTTKELAENRGITTRTASTILKGLVERNLLIWHGSSPQDSQQYYEITPKSFSQ